MSEMHSKQRRFTYSVCGPFTKNKERVSKFEETRDSSYIYQNELDKRTVADKVLHHKELNIAKNPKRDGYQRGF